MNAGTKKRKISHRAGKRELMLEPKMAGTYVRYPYLAFHYNRAPR